MSFLSFCRAMLVSLGFPSRRFARKALVPSSPGPVPPFERTGQVIHCAAIALADPTVFPTFGAMLASTEMRGFIPAAFVAQKAKAVCDGILAALEGVSTDGNAMCLGIDAFLSALFARLAPGDPNQDRIGAALDLARGVASTRPFATLFLGQPVRAKPLGFYTWSNALTRVFQRDRFLQQELEEEEADVLWAAVRGDPSLLAAYVHHVRRIARLTNRLDRPTLPEPYASPPFRKKKAFFPASVSVENGFSTVFAFFSAVRSQRVSLAPQAASGFYAHQLRALDPLLRPDAFPEASARTVDPEYAAALELFAAANLFLARESHVKQLALSAPEMASARPTQWVHPGFRIEPLPSYYAFVGDAFRFLKTVITEGWGEDALGIQQLRERGPIAATVAEGIAEVIDVCETAVALSRRELSGDVSSPEVLAARERLDALRKDDDVTADARGMVPLGFTPDGQLRVLVFAGWEVHGLRIKLTALPGKPPGVGLGGEQHPLPIPIVSERVIAPAALLDRNEVRRLCDEALATRVRTPLGPHGRPAIARLA